MNTFEKTIKNTGIFVRLLIIFWPPILVFLLHVVLVRVTNIYLVLPRLDVPTHYVGGLSLAYSFALAIPTLKNQKAISQLDRLVELVLIFTLVSTAAIFWEFAEFLLDRFLGTNLQISLQNTMQDLLMGMLGAATIVVYKIVKGSEQPFLGNSETEIAGRD
jgi:hypothetical protein